MKREFEYIIVGTTKINDEDRECMITPCHTDNKEEAEKRLNEFLNSKNERDIEDKKKFTNIHLDITDDPWWNDPYYTRD